MPESTFLTGEALRAARLRRGLRVGQLARIVAMSRVTVWRAENRAVAERTRRALALALGFPLDGFEGAPPVLDGARGRGSLAEQSNPPAARALVGASP